MQCVRGDCGREMIVPRISIFIGDAEEGADWGYYCSPDCALIDMGDVLLKKIGEDVGPDTEQVADPHHEDALLAAVGVADRLVTQLAADVNFHYDEHVLDFNKTQPQAMFTMGHADLNEGLDVVLSPGQVLFAFEISNGRNVIAMVEGFDFDTTYPTLLQYMRTTIQEMQEAENAPLGAVATPDNGF